MTHQIDPDLEDGSALAYLRRTDPDARRTSVDEVYDQILRWIICGKLASGEVLICTRLADQLGVSRTPVVSAVDRLARDGVLVKEKNRRAQVRATAGAWLLHIHQLREIVEPAAARLAAMRFPDEALDELESMADETDPAHGGAWQEPARRFDFALHLSIADHCGNQPLRETIYKCWKFKRLSYQLGCSNPEIEEIGYREHLAILLALRQSDAETAAAAMLFHLRSSFNYTKQQEVV